MRIVLSVYILFTGRDAADVLAIFTRRRRWGKRVSGKCSATSFSVRCAILEAPPSGGLRGSLELLAPPRSMAESQEVREILAKFSGNAGDKVQWRTSAGR